MSLTALSPRFCDGAGAQGTEGSRVEAVLRAVPEGRPASLGGLEGTAPGGEGEGVEPFRAAPRLVEIGISMRVPLDKARHRRWSA